MNRAAEIAQLHTNLREWFELQQRDLPWRRTRDPYAIWISEIMLQQTRVTAVIPYYERFLASFPDFQTLAGATERDLLGHWAGLGYYYRAKNLRKAAQIMQVTGGFPSDYAGIRRLPGIGDYTAAAIASIAFDLPHAVLDGNVLRALSRLFNDATNIASSAGRRHFAKAADLLLDRSHPGVFNQAMMELGATICLPVNPQCLVCPVSNSCRARASGTQNQLPVKIVTRKNAQEQRRVFWIEHDGRILLWQRPADSRLMPGFWELPESSHLQNVQAGRKLGAFRHTITFHNYRLEVIEASAPAEIGSCAWVSMDALDSLPLSTIFKKAKRIVEKYRSEHAPVSIAASNT